MGAVLNIIAKETDGNSYKSAKYCHDNFNISGIEYDHHNEVVWKDYGETEKHKKPINLENRANIYKTKDSIFKYFLDGSRHTYKVDDISYNQNVYPVLAGQIAVGCCKRIDKQLKNEEFSRHFVIVLPEIAYRDEWLADRFFADILNKVNNQKRLKDLNIKFDNILTYPIVKDDEKIEKKGIAVIQDYMIEMEKNAVAQLTSQHKLGQNNFLIKDGSLEYKVVKNSKNNLRNKHIANNYQWVIGVSKSFNPTKCLIKSGGSNSDIIANLKPFERTPAYMYQSQIAGDICFAIWYIRLREVKFTSSAFGGVVKIEKILIRDEEKENGLDSEMIDHISAHLINERNPVCYGKDLRWGNHLYPVSLTESFIKSKYISNDLFLHLF